MLQEINPGTLVNNRYQVQKVLGQGGFGRTYLAFDVQRFDEACVLKEFVPENTKEDLVRKSRELFEREAKILYQINHPQIPKFLAWLTEEDRLFIVQEYIQGKTYSELLYDRLSQQKVPFSEAEVIQWLQDLLPVLTYIHLQNIIHRDISLDNVMFSNKQSKPVLIDFGVVKEKVTEIFSTTEHNASPFARGSIVGKVGYSPPEQIYMGQCYPCSDIYALGVSALVLLTGKMPNLLIDYLTLKWQWRSHISISEPLGKILDKMLAEQPAQRYQSAREVLSALQSMVLGYTMTNEPTRTLGIPPLNLKRDTSTKTPINPEFLELCRQELTRSVGPFASLLLEEVLTRFPNINCSQLVEALMAEIPHPQRAEEFRKRMKLE
ncbi:MULTISPECIES: serine/threonine-protein kinase [Nostocales]|uniref:non-specific serine/threonine protein kinase n=3 Tax=Nostocales TaxID=1161 RepID=A0A0C1QZU1_9CYAN|nr:serine/threonine-protein kinase [Tolypothrix bouteillei]KAF3885222.1 serine/threonine protein kinase [Tolypothrix bouteillei VB521301]